MISVIIPAYNVEKYIGACLDSVLAQEGVDLEIIVVDDESTDSTMSIIKDYATRYSCIKPLQCSHGGPSTVRNLAMRHITGQWITMVDGDDLLAPHALRRMLDVAESNQDIDFVAGRWKRFTDYFSPRPCCNTIPVKLSGHEAAEIMLYQKKYTDIVNPSACGKLYHREVWDNVEFSEGTIYEDLYLLPQLSATTNMIAVIDDTVYGYRRNSNSLLHTFSPKRLDALTVTARLCDCFAGDKKLCKAARSRHFSAAFNLWLLIEVNNPSMTAEMAECRRVVRRLAVSQLFGRKVRLKNRIGALLQYFPFIFKSTYLCKKLLAK